MPATSTKGLCKHTGFRWARAEHETSNKKSFPCLWHSVLLQFWGAACPPVWPGTPAGKLLVQEEPPGWRHLPSGAGWEQACAQESSATGRNLLYDCHLATFHSMLQGNSGQGEALDLWPRTDSSSSAIFPFLPTFFTCGVVQTVAFLL